MLRKIYLLAFIVLAGVYVRTATAAGHLVNLELTHLKCYNACNGKAKALVTGASGTVVIKWLGNGLPPNTVGDSIINLCPGLYTVEAVDLSDNSSTGLITFEILNAPPFFRNILKTNVTCYGDSDGVATIIMSGGTPPYRYLWSTGANDTLNTIDSLPAGSYSVTVTDTNGCVFHDTVAITQPDSLIANVTGKMTNCKDGCTGWAQSIPIGGTAPFSYNWDNGDTIYRIEDLCAGVYRLELTDANSCMVIDSFVVTEPDSLKSAFIIDSTACADSCNGAIEAVVTGGIRPYYYNWAPGASADSVITGLCAGNYTATVTDSNGCFLMENIVVESAIPITLDDSVFSAGCGVCNGKIKLFPSGGHGPYSYVWNTGNPADTLDTLGNLCSGVYSVIITDTSMCSREFSFILNDSTGVNGITAMVQAVSCFGAADGAATVRPVGGTKPFTYSWLPGGQTDSTIQNVAAGTYYATIIDAGGCKKTTQVVIGGPDPVVFNPAVVNANCNGSCDGQITVKPTGGTAPYAFLWIETGGLTSTATGLCPGLYHLDITDAEGCTFTDSFRVDTAVAISLSVNEVNASCFGTCDGSASVGVTGGVAPYTYQWSNGSANDTTLGLCAGSYSVTITDANGCQATTGFVIGQPTTIVPNLTTTKAQCNFNDGKAFLAPGGGAGAYTYLWFNNTTKDSLTGLSAGLYSVKVSDTNGCSINVNVPISNTGGPSVSVKTNHVKCHGACSGSAVVTATSGHGPYEYDWSTGDSTASVSGLCAGNHFVQVKDGNGCITVQQVTVTEPPAINVNLSGTGVSCQGSCDGTGLAVVSGGLPPYRYSWQGGGMRNAITGLCGGNYNLTVTDTNNCAVTVLLEVDEPEELEISFVRKNLSCPNLCDGELKAKVSGGQAPFTYSWSTGATSSDITALCSGKYYVDIQDANGCTISDTISVGSVNPPIVANANVTNAACGSCNGSVTINASGGNGAPFTYLWSPGNYTGSVVNDLCAGIYNVEVTDNGGCSRNITVTVSNIGGPALTDSIVSASCYGTCDGKAIITAAGSAPFDYFWNDPMLQLSDTASGLCAGSYQVMVMDNAGCLSVRSVNIGEPSEIQISLNKSPITCIGDSSGALAVGVSGGAPPYTYLWSTSPNDTLSFIDTLKAGSYSLIITDTNSCTRNDTFVLSDPQPMILTMSATNVLCHGACNGTATVKVNGGQPPYSVTWNDPSGQSGNKAIGLCSGTYTATITDANGCTAVDSIELVEPASFSLNFVPSNPSCFDGSNGSIVINPTGGTGPYTYQWSNGQSGNVASGLKAGQYTVTGIDSKSCVAYDTIILNNPAKLTSNFVVTAPQCDSANGAIQATPAGGSGNYSYLWNTIPTKTTATVTKIPAGIVKVTITDNVSLCKADFSVIVNNTGGPALSVSVVDESCFGACNGSANAMAPTATDFLWNDPSGQITATASDLCAGTYTVTVTDAAGCKSSDTVRIKTYRITTIATDIRQPRCSGGCDGEATVSSSGGRAPYVYSWNTTPVQAGSRATSLCAGSYEVSTTDSTNCVDLTSVIITDPAQLNLNLNLLAGNQCFDACDGIAEAMVSGGIPPYSYAWSDGQTTRNATGLCAGSYTLTVTDSKGCMAIDTILVNGVTQIVANAIITKPLCGMHDGTISLSPAGGKGPYKFTWSHGKNTAVVSNLFAGIYSVIIEDANHCSKEFTFFLNNPNAPNLNFANNTVNCEGDCNGIAVVMPLGGVAPYRYTWDYIPPSYTDSLKGLCSGAYSVKVTDAVGCIAFGNDTIGEPERLTANPTIDNTGCGGQCISVASANPSGGTPPYSFQWNTVPVTTTNVATGLCDGTYQIMIIDTNDCAYFDSVTIVTPPALMVDSFSVVSASCNSNEDGQATVYVSGGVTPYRYFWNNGSLTASIINVTGGIKVVEITDTNECKIKDTVIVPVIDTVTVKAMDDFDACVGQEIELVATGTGVISYQWFTIIPNIVQVGNDDSILVTLTDTTIYVIRGSNGSTPVCFDRDTVIVNAIPPPVVNAGPDETIVRGGSTILDNVTPFIPQGFYEWVPGTGLDDSTVIRPRASPKETTTYVIHVTDEYGCKGSDTIMVFVTDRTTIFNGFTPNGDGVNDYWTIELIEDYPNAVVEVYNRWGVQVFRSVGYKQKWDGTYEGENLPEGTYYYVIDLKTEGLEPLTGPITLMR